MQHWEKNLYPILFIYSKYHLLKGPFRYHKIIRVENCNLSTLKLPSNITLNFHVYIVDKTFHQEYLLHKYM